MEGVRKAYPLQATPLEGATPPPPDHPGEVLPSKRALTLLELVKGSTEPGASVAAASSRLPGQAQEPYRAVARERRSVITANAVP